MANLTVSSAFKTHYCQFDAFRLSCWFLPKPLTADRDGFVHDNNLHRSDLLSTENVLTHDLNSGVKGRFHTYSSYFRLIV